MSEGNADWYYSMGGQQQGPAPLEHLQGWLANGQLQPTELVWREGMAEWAAAHSVPELQGFVPQGGPAAAGFAVAQTPYGAVPTAAGGAFQVNYYTPGQQIAYASFWLRFCAVIVDGLIVGAPFIIIGLIVDSVFDVQNKGPSPAHTAVTGLLQLVNLVVGWLYEALQTSGPHMATFGKRAVGIRVTDLNGGRMSFGRATGRHFAKILSSCTLLIGFIMAAFTERKQALHDMIASTLVLQGKAPR